MSGNNESPVGDQCSGTLKMGAPCPLLTAFRLDISVSLYLRVAFFFLCWFHLSFASFFRKSSICTDKCFHKIVLTYHTKFKSLYSWGQKLSQISRLIKHNSYCLNHRLKCIPCVYVKSKKMSQKEAQAYLNNGGTVIRDPPKIPPVVTT